MKNFNGATAEFWTRCRSLLSARSCVTCVGHTPGKLAMSVSVLGDVDPPFRGDRSGMGRHGEGPYILNDDIGI